MESFRPPFSKGGRFQWQSLWPPIAMGGTLLFAPRARIKRKKRSHELMYQFMTCRPAADDPAPAFCLQNAGLEFPKFLSTAHLRQQITPLCAICQPMLSFSTGGGDGFRKPSPLSWCSYTVFSASQRFCGAFFFSVQPAQMFL